MNNIKNNEINISSTNGINENLKIDKNIDLSLDISDDINKFFNSQKMSYKEYLMGTYCKEFNLVLDRNNINVKSINLENLKLLDTSNIKKSTNAYIDFDEDKNEYIIVDETIGTEINENKLKEFIKDSIYNQSFKVILENKDFKQPTILSSNESLNKTMNDLNEYLNTTITYDMRYTKEIVDKKTISKFVSYENNKIIFNDEEIENYVKSLKQKYDTFGIDRKFKNSNGKEITITGGDYGWLIDSSEEVKQLKEDIQNKKDITRTPIYKYEGQRKTEDEIGNTYVEISLENQHIWLYVDGNLIIDSDIVTGKANRSATPPGVYCLTYKTRNAVLRGPGYASPVSYWMPFNGGIGMHDATWRSSFGGTIYKTNGSHGCVNLPLNVAKTIYENIQDDTPIILY